MFPPLLQWYKADKYEIFLNNPVHKKIRRTLWNSFPSKCVCFHGYVKMKIIEVVQKVVEE